MTTFTPSPFPHRGAFVHSEDPSFLRQGIGPGGVTTAAEITSYFRPKPDRRAHLHSEDSSMSSPSVSPFTETGQRAERRGLPRRNRDLHPTEASQSEIDETTDSARPLQAVARTGKRPSMIGRPKYQSIKSALALPVSDVAAQNMRQEKLLPRESHPGTEWIPTNITTEGLPPKDLHPGFVWTGKTAQMWVETKLTTGDLGGERPVTLPEDIIPKSQQATLLIRQQSSTDGILMRAYIANVDAFTAYRLQHEGTRSPPLAITTDKGNVVDRLKFRLARRSKLPNKDQERPLHEQDRNFTDPRDDKVSRISGESSQNHCTNSDEESVQRTAARKHRHLFTATSNKDSKVFDNHNDVQPHTRPQHRSARRSFRKSKKSPTKSPSFLAAEAVRITTPPANESHRGKLRGFFFDYRPPGHENSDKSSIRPPVLPSHSSDDMNWFRVSVGSETVEDPFEDHIPDHLPSSPLCPKHVKHPSGGTGTCPSHGRNRRESDVSP